LPSCRSHLQQPQKIARPWRIVAAEAAEELDSQHLLTLLEELNQALEQQGMAQPDDKYGWDTARN
jgi:hypothetical protein